MGYIDKVYVEFKLCLEFFFIKWVGVKVLILWLC